MFDLHIYLTLKLQQLSNIFQISNFRSLEKTLKTAQDGRRSQCYVKHLV